MPKSLYNLKVTGWIFLPECRAHLTSMAKSATAVWDSRRNNLDFLRLALAVLVILSHSYPLGTATESTEPMHRWTRGQMTFGAVAVDLFFVMSGFLITASVLRSPTLWVYMQRRISRIYPGFITASLLGVGLFGVIGAERLVANHWLAAGDFLLQTLRLREFTFQSAFSANPYPNAINGSLWSIQYEFWCYIGVALLAAASILRRPLIVAVLLGVSVLVGVYFQASDLVLGGKWLGVLLGSPQLWARLLPFYLAGMVFYLFRGHIPLQGWIAAAALASLVAACWWPWGWAALFPLSGTYLVFYLAFQPRLPLSQAGKFGDFSYGTYLYAFPVQQVLMQHFGHLVAPWRLFVVALPITLLFAVASWYGVERRFLRPVRRKETLLHAAETGAA